MVSGATLSTTCTLHIEEFLAFLLCAVGGNIKQLFYTAVYSLNMVQ